jgi:hypothetical protein
MSRFQTLAPQPADIVLPCRCDELQLDGKPKPSTTIRGTYSHAQKMRASMTYMFSRIYGLGSLPWHKNETTGRMIGNPSVSQTVSSYMLSLRCRKVGSYMTLPTGTSRRDNYKCPCNHTCKLVPHLSGARADDKTAVRKSSISFTISIMSQRTERSQLMPLAHTARRLPTNGGVAAPAGCLLQLIPLPSGACFESMRC